MGNITKRISEFRGINRSLRPGAIDLSYAYDAVNVDIVGGMLNNGIGSQRLVSSVDVPAGKPFLLYSPTGNYLVFRDKYIAMGGGYTKQLYTLLGDANCDGRVSASDGALVLRYLAGLQTITPQGLLNADVDFSGTVTADDANKILASVERFYTLNPKWDDPNVTEVGPYEPDRPQRTLRAVQNVSNDSSLNIRGVGLNTVYANIDNIDCVIASGMLASGSGFFTERGFYTDGKSAKTAVYYLGSENTPVVHCRQFGSGLYMFKNIEVTGKTNTDGVLTSITIDKTYASLTDAQKSRLTLDGIYLFSEQIVGTVDEDDINNAYMWLEVTSVESGTGGNAKLNVKTTRLADDVLSPSYAYLRGGCSNMPVTFMQMHYGRLFAAASRSQTAHMRRLYWSCLPGDGRTIEDWTFSDASIETSGGHVDVGDPSDECITGLVECNRQLLIFTKRRLWRLYGYSPSNYTLEVIGELEGTRVSNPVEVNGTIYWLSLSGISYYNGSYIATVDDNYSTRHLLESFPRYMSDAMHYSSVHASLFDNSIMFAFDDNSGINDACTVLRYELETNNVFTYRVPCENYLQQFCDSVKDNFGMIGGNVVKNETRYFQALVHNNGTMTMTQWYNWGRQKIDWYDDQPVSALWQSGWSDMQSPEAVKKVQTICLRGSGEFTLTLESEKNKDVIEVKMPENSYEVKEIVPRYAEGRTFRITIESDKPFEIEPYMTLLYEAGAKR